jgi:hypothetical protein
VLAIALPLAGCGLFHRHFDIAVGNRTVNSVSIFADGGKLGDVGPSSTVTFSVEETPLGRTTVDTGVTPSSTKPIAQVTFSAQDLATGALSAGVPATLVKDITTYLDVAPCATTATGDVSASPCVSVANTNNVAPPGGSTGSGGGGQTCTFTLAASEQSQGTGQASGTSMSFTATGGTGSLNVTTSATCAWTAISSQSWLTVVSGSPGVGPGIVAFQVAPNLTGMNRAASLTIGGQTFTINQSA